MPARKRSSTGATLSRHDYDVQREISSFLRALNSYPECFAHNPLITFEQHFVNVSTAQAHSLASGGPRS